MGSRLVSRSIHSILANVQALRRNLSYPEMRAAAVNAGEVCVASNQALACDTGKYTGRSPNDKFIVKRSPSSNNIWWGDINKPCSSEVFDKLHHKVLDHYTNVESPFVFDGFCGANPATRKKVRVVSELAWQHHFARNMFITPVHLPEFCDFTPDFTIINACKVTNEDFLADQLHSEAFVLFDIENQTGLIGGTWYAGEMKKGMFSMMNYWLPQQGIMPMHCSANVGANGDVALFFGLSGTGKTTLSADPKRALIGDDEHGWDQSGIFNFEGGCYAKTIGLSAKEEPDIYAAIREGAILENVALVGDDFQPDYNDVEKTQNGRVSFPLSHIENRIESGQAGHPDNIIFLTCDAFGILPPVSCLNTGQAMYQFMSGYTAKIAGTERGIKEPTPTFSACYGEAFLKLHPSVYAELLSKKLDTHQCRVYLVNTGWTGGGYGVGKRISITETRSCIDAILAGAIQEDDCVVDPIFEFKIPTSLPGVDRSILIPRNTWSDKEEYDSQAIQLAEMFQANYKKFIQPGMIDYSQFGPKL